MVRIMFPPAKSLRTIGSCRESEKWKRSRYRAMARRQRRTDPCQTLCRRVTRGHPVPADPDKGLGPMSQHFLLSREVRTLSLSQIMRVTGDEARDTFASVGPQIMASRAARIAVA